MAYGSGVCNTSVFRCGAPVWPIKAPKQPAEPAGCLAGEVLVDGVCRFPAARIEVPAVDRCGMEFAPAGADVSLVFAMIFARLFVCR